MAKNYHNNHRNNNSNGENIHYETGPILAKVRTDGITRHIQNKVDAISQKIQNSNPDLKDYHPIVNIASHMITYPKKKNKGDFRPLYTLSMVLTNVLIDGNTRENSNIPDCYFDRDEDAVVHLFPELEQLVTLFSYDDETIREIMKMAKEPTGYKDNYSKSNRCVVPKIASLMEQYKVPRCRNFGNQPNVTEGVMVFLDPIYVLKDMLLQQSDYLPNGETKSYRPLLKDVIQINKGIHEFRCGKEYNGKKNYGKGVNIAKEIEDMVNISRKRY